MPADLTPDDFLRYPDGGVIVDVRTPAEFAQGHIPGAVNVPLFSNEERAEIGTAYVQQGRAPAVSLGLRRVGPRLDELAQTLLGLTDPANPRLRIHCWRGGMRSGSVALLMEAMFGCRVATLRGGYKAFRRWVLASFDISRKLRVVAGRGDERFPLLIAARRGIEHELEVDVHEPRHVLGAFDVAAHPVNRISDAAQHGGRMLPAADFMQPLPKAMRCR